MYDLTEDEADLIYLLFFEEVSVKEAAKICGHCRKKPEQAKAYYIKTSRNHGGAWDGSGLLVIGQEKYGFN